MKTWKEFLAEQAKAVKGDWEGHGTTPILHLDSVGERQFNKQFTEIESAFAKTQDKTLSLYKHKHEAKYRLGYWYTESIPTKAGNEQRHRWQTIAYIDLTRNKTIKLNSKKVFRVDLVFVDNDYREAKLATLLYNYLILKEGYSILGDATQFFGARKLWSRLSKQLDLVVDIININTGHVVFSDVVLHQGQQDKDYDARLWDYSDSKLHLRSILKQIK